MAYARLPCDEAVIRTPAEAPPCSKRTGNWVLAATILGSSMAFIDGSVVNVALPVLQADLRATIADVQWVVEIYSLFLSALILVGGALGDRFGRRWIFGAGIVLFSGASAGCGLSQTINELILARAVQGIGGALLVPGSLAIISASFSKEERGKAIGTWAGFSAITSGLGPLTGGWLIEHVSWRAIFFLNIPIAAVVIAILVTNVPESRNEDARRLDLVGGLLATAGLGGIVYGLIESTTLGLGDPLVLTALVAGAAILVVFVVVEDRSDTAMMPLFLFHSRQFSGANLLTLLLYGALGGATFFLPFNLIRVHGYSATGAGAAFLPFIVVMFVLSRWSGGLIQTFGEKLPLVVGPLIAGIGIGMFALPGTGGSYWATFFPASTVMGLGMAIAVSPLTTVVMSAVDEGRAGIASGINNAASRAAGLIAIAVLSIAVVQVFSTRLQTKLSGLKLTPHAREAIYAQRAKLTDIQLPPGLSAPVRASVQHAIAQSFVDSFRVSVLIGALMAALSALVAATMIGGRRKAHLQVAEETPAELRPEPSA